MCVVVHELRNRLLFNGLRGHVLFVREDDWLCVRLHGNGKLLILRAENVRQWFSPAGITRNVRTMEFALGTSKKDIAAFFRTYAINEDTEMCTLLRPVLALLSANMSTEIRALLVQSARLEHMGSL